MPVAAVKRKTNIAARNRWLYSLPFHGRGEGMAIASCIIQFDTGTIAQTAPGLPERLVAAFLILQPSGG